MIGMRDYGMLSGGSANTQVWGSTGGTIPIESLSSCVVKYPVDGSEISAATAAMIAQPKLLVLCVGNDGLAGASEEAFRGAYKGLIDLLPPYLCAIAKISPMRTASRHTRMPSVQSISLNPDSLPFIISPECSDTVISQILPLLLKADSHT